MLQAVANAFKLPDLRKKIVFTLVILVIYRLAAHIPVPGVDAEALRAGLSSSNQLLGLLDMFSGGAMANFSVMAMGVYPFITAQIVLQLLQPIIPALDALAKEGEAGRAEDEHVHAPPDDPVGRSAGLCAGVAPGQARARPGPVSSQLWLWRRTAGCRRWRR